MDTTKILQNFYDNGQLWYQQHMSNGKIHNENGPAIKMWYKNGQPMRIEYLRNGKYCNKNGPVMQRWNKNGKLELEAY